MASFVVIIVIAISLMLFKPEKFQIFSLIEYNGDSYAKYHFRLVFANKWPSVDIYTDF